MKINFIKLTNSDSIYEKFKAKSYDFCCENMRLAIRLGILSHDRCDYNLGINREVKSPAWPNKIENEMTTINFCPWCQEKIEFIKVEDEEIDPFKKSVYNFQIILDDMTEEKVIYLMKNKSYHCLNWFENIGKIIQYYGKLPDFWNQELINKIMLEVAKKHVWLDEAISNCLIFNYKDEVALKDLTQEKVIKLMQDSESEINYHINKGKIFQYFHGQPNFWYEKIIKAGIYY